MWRRTVLLTVVSGIAVAACGESGTHSGTRQPPRNPLVRALHRRKACEQVHGVQWCVKKFQFAVYTQACKGLPTAKHSEGPLVLFGAVRNLDKRFLCAHFGWPILTRNLSGGREGWTYPGGDIFILRHGHVIQHAVPSS